MLDDESTATLVHAFVVSRIDYCCSLLFGSPKTLSLSVLTAIIQVNLGYPVFIEAKDDGGGGGNWTTRTISRAKL